MQKIWFWILDLLYFTKQKIRDFYLTKVDSLFWLELIATILYAVSVFLFGSNPETASPWVFPMAWTLSTIASGLYVVFFYKKRLYSDMFEMAIYVPTSIMGLCGLAVAIMLPAVLAVNVITRSLTYLVIILIGTFIFRFIVKLLNTKSPKIWPEPASPWLDAFTTIASLAATFLLMSGGQETWVIWCIVDILAVYIYAKNKSYIVMASYVLYTLNTVRGFINWG